MAVDWCVQAFFCPSLPFPVSYEILLLPVLPDWVLVANVQPVDLQSAVMSGKCCLLPSPPTLELSIEGDHG